MSLNEMFITHKKLKTVVISGIQGLHRRWFWGVGWVVTPRYFYEGVVGYP